MLSWNDFEKINICCGTIMEVHDFPEAKNPAYRLMIDFGNYGLKRSSAQITNLYNKEDLLHTQVIAVINFAPKQIANFISECLVLGIYSDDNVVLLQPERTVANGTKVG